MTTESTESPSDWDAEELTFWLRHDTWTTSEAIALLVGIDPDSIVWKDELDSWGLKRFRRLRNGLGLCATSDSEFFERIDLELAHEKAMRLARSGPNRTGTVVRTPREWIEWAISKGIEVPWLVWATERGLMGEDPSVRVREGEALEGPVGARERTTLLLIIAGLAKIGDVDISKPSKAAGQIVTAIEVVGARVSQRAIEDHLRSVPAAVERRSSDALPKR